LFESNLSPVPGSTLANYPTIWTPETSRSFNRPPDLKPLTYAQRKADMPWSGLKETAFFRGPTSEADNAPTITKAAMQMSDADFEALLAAGGQYSIDYTDPRLRLVPVSKGTPVVKPAGFPVSPFGGELLFWDWGKPGYCRNQLLQIGFSESDLTP
jgi:hypothetical protein